MVDTYSLRGLFFATFRNKRLSVISAKLNSVDEYGKGFFSSRIRLFVVEIDF